MSSLRGRRALHSQGLRERLVRSECEDRSELVAPRVRLSCRNASEDLPAVVGSATVQGRDRRSYGGGNGDCSVQVVEDVIELATKREAQIAALVILSSECDPRCRQLRFGGPDVLGIVELEAPREKVPD